MQWSTFPMNTGRSARIRSLAKLFVRSLFSRDRVWIKTYPATLLYWLGIRRRFRSMKVRERELNEILSRIEEQC
jgi:hypothetical protein